MSTVPVVLGVESSCDETGFALVSNGELLGQGLASSASKHAEFGGVVPEIAARAHLEAAVPTLQIALHDAGVNLRDITHVAATSGPGLATAVHVGLAAAKSVAWSLDVPLYGVHHLAGHAAADTLEHGPLPEQAVILIVSGGHTSVLHVKDLVRDPIEHLGDTLDDAAGEAFDKVSRLLGLGYPGGPAISKAAVGGDPEAFSFPRAMLRPGDAPYAFSFSGLKTAVARTVETIERAGDAVPVADIAASFEQAVVDVLVTKSLRAVQEKGLETLVIVGGVAANQRLRAVAQERCDAAGVELRIPPIRLCTDNGAMIAAVGDLLVRADAEADGLGIAADPSAVLHGAQLPLPAGFQV
ncbi:tRNA (adenosine(37)-N6)-threonylcarbamoyltransferase complex transferase subunit TsaD [Brachybacterium endophyticum]|uniref:tRNA N6-adenosine threonylcarbamoyltransferase n=1 Tax=Brachybacterium endophyticum TaxID=2182385 RepID=A0A2U2RHN4_9MICO|nr:tRNA (adenosine(37)-N6)-threonylcarbamoyltransferase complex transferase subunit TsaD [Brachybacterium endophyticum]PWH05377.1 tRNA (adenosine(37)-N6)-threonylcarbamoyltransferase complex transferase subunit TsaD [Brachybacterium endophyticum]